MKCPKCKSTDIFWHMPEMNQTTDNMVEVGFCCNGCGKEFYALVSANVFVPVDSE